MSQQVHAATSVSFASAALAMPRPLTLKALHLWCILHCNGNRVIFMIESFENSPVGEYTRHYTYYGMEK